jgi:hypothetical protein
MSTEEETSCWLWHSWGPWSEPRPKLKGDWYLGDYQDRRCLDCNKIQRRYL